MCVAVYVAVCEYVLQCVQFLRLRVMTLLQGVAA